jgi:hypothetical protein
VLGDDEQSDYYSEPGPAAGGVSWSDMNSDGDVCADSKQHEASVDNVCEVRTFGISQQLQGLDFVDVNDVLKCKLILSYLNV